MPKKSAEGYSGAAGSQGKMPTGNFGNRSVNAFRSKFLVEFKLNRNKL